MKKISFELIKKIDFVLIFIFLILGIITWAIIMINIFNPFSGSHTVSNAVTIVEDDTKEDNIALYISDYDGKNLIKISNSVYKVRITDNNQLLFTEYDGSLLTFFLYDINLNKKTKLKSAEQEAPEKYISFY